MDKKAKYRRKHRAGMCLKTGIFARAMAILAFSLGSFALQGKTAAHPLRTEGRWKTGGPELRQEAQTPGPGSPRHLIVPPESATSSSITLLWNKAEHYAAVKAYYIYQDGAHVATTDKTHYTITHLAPATSHVFYVRAVNGAGDLSAPGNKVTARTKPAGKIFKVTDYGARGDGVTKDTKAIQRAIDACTPGGTVYIPSGVFLSGALYLKSDMTLYIAGGGVLKGSTDAADYLPMIRNRFEGWELTTYASLLNAGTMNSKGGYSLRHLSIRGEGTISGGGEPLAKAMIAQKGLRGRGRLILLMNCQDVNIQGLTIEGSPCWTIHYIYSDNITLHDLTIRSSVPNGDGVDPDSSTGSYIFNCSFSTGDDCIAIKSGKNPEGYYIARPTEGVWISDCHFIRGHGISIGSEMSGGVRDVLVRDCVAGNLLNGMQIKGTKDRGGFVEDVRVKDCDLRKITIFSSVGYNNDGKPAPVTPYYKNFTFSHIDMSKAVDNPVIIVQGFDDTAHYTRDVTFQDITLPEDAVATLSHCKHISFKNVYTTHKKKPAYKVADCMDISH